MYCKLICTPMWTKFYSCKKWVLHMKSVLPGEMLAASSDTTVVA
jgi:hypothetical protein